MKTLWAVVRRDLLLAFRLRADVLNTLAFFVIVTTLFPLGIGPDANQLRSIAPGVVWVAALLASLLSLARLFAADHADGTLEQMLLAPYPLALIVFGKVAAHWLATGLPVVVLGKDIVLHEMMQGSELGPGHRQCAFQEAKTPPPFARRRCSWWNR